jgi:hypothetical protein
VHPYVRPECPPLAIDALAIRVTPRCAEEITGSTGRSNALAAMLVSQWQEGAPMPQVQTKKITFKAARAVELEPGLVLRPGFYTGTKTRTRVDSIGGISWTPSKYKLELTANQLKSMSAQIELNLISKNIDVTKFVRQGKLICV